VKENLDHIEAKENLRVIQFAEPGVRSPYDEFLFRPVDGAGRFPELTLGSRFHFSKDECIDVAIDDVDLTSSVRSKIPIQDLPPGSSQFLRRETFPRRADESVPFPSTHRVSIRKPRNRVEFPIEPPIPKLIEKFHSTVD
jgi:hypothetical protein